MNNQSHKIAQITPKTLVIGIDMIVTVFCTDSLVNKKFIGICTIKTTNPPRNTDYNLHNSKQVLFKSLNQFAV